MLLSLVSLAWAADPPASEGVALEQGRAVRYEERTELDFDPLSLEGEHVGPSGQRVDERPRPVFNPLIQLRTDWKRELRWSIDDVK